MLSPSSWKRRVCSWMYSTIWRLDTLVVFASVTEPRCRNYHRNSRPGSPPETSASLKLSPVISLSSTWSFQTSQTGSSLRSLIIPQHNEIISSDRIPHHLTSAVLSLDGELVPEWPSPPLFHFIPLFFSWEPTRLPNWLNHFCRNKSSVFPVLCSILFILYSYFYILYFLQIVLMSMAESVSHCHSGGCCDIILFNVGFVILCQQHNFSTKRYCLVIHRGNTHVCFLGRWHRSPFMIRAQDTCLIYPCVIHDDSLYEWIQDVLWVPVAHH